MLPRGKTTDPTGTCVKVTVKTPGLSRGGGGGGRVVQPLGSRPGCFPFSLGHLPSCTRVFGPPQLSALWNATHAISRVALFSVSAVRELSLWVASPGVRSQPHLSIGRFLGRRPFVRSTIARGRVTTDPQSPKGGSQRSRHSKSTHPTASGRLSTVVLVRQPYPALANGGVTLRLLRFLSSGVGLPATTLEWTVLLNNGGDHP